MNNHFSDEPKRPLMPEFRARLAQQLTSFRHRLVYAEIGANCYKTVTVELDELGTPAETVHVGTDHAEFRARLARLAAGEHDEIVIVTTRADQTHADHADLAELAAAHPEAAVIALPGADTEGIVRAELARVPLRYGYELLTLRRVEGNERPRLHSQPLFAEGAQPGETVRTRLICTNPYGTLLVVLVWRGPTNPVLVSVHRATLPPGPYLLQARLERAGEVSFPGVDDLIADDRLWPEIVATVPERLDRDRRPAHLVCAIEACGTEQELNDRRDRVRELIAKIGAIHQEPDGLLVSIVAYGGHDFEAWRGDNSRPEVVVWAATEPQATEALDQIRLQPVTDPDGAQVEDVLVEVEARLAAMDSAGTTALVTVGRRAPHPPRTLPSVDLLPCPRRHDWVAAIRRLRERQGVRLGAICDLHPAATPSVWERLGAHGLFFLDACDVDAFAVQLNLAMPPGSALQLPLTGINGGFGGV